MVDDHLRGIVDEGSTKLGKIAASPSRDWLRELDRSGPWCVDCLGHYT